MANHLEVGHALSSNAATGDDFEVLRRMNTTTLHSSGRAGGAAEGL